MNSDLLYDSQEQMNATQRVIATMRVQMVNKEIDDLLSEIIQYARNIDKVLERNNFDKRYLDRVSSIDNVGDSGIILDSDLENVDFRIKEVIEDYIKRINTRINIIRSDNELIKELESGYKILDEDLAKDIAISELAITSFQE